MVTSMEPVRGEVALMQALEGGRAVPRSRKAGSPFSQAANAVRALQAASFFCVKSAPRAWAAVGVANERPRGCGIDDGCLQTIDSSFPNARIRTHPIDIVTL